MGERPETFVDPFTLAYERLWDVVEGNRRWAELVKPGNRVALTGRRNPPKGMRRLAGDLTEAILLPAPTGQAVNLRATSSTSLATVLYNFRIKTDTPELAKMVFPLKYAFLGAFAAAPDDLGMRGVVAGHRIVDAADDALGDIAQFFGSQGWTSVYTVEVRFQLGNADLTADLR